MAYSAIFPYRKGIKLSYKKNPFSVKEYSSADNRIWSNDRMKKYVGLRDAVTYAHDYTKFMSSSSDEKDKQLIEFREKYENLLRIYNELKTACDKNFPTPIIQDNADSDIKEIPNDQTENTKQITAKYEEILKERDSLKDLLNKMRAEMHDMEEEIQRLKNEYSEHLKSCGSGGSGDKLKIQPSRANSDSDCNKCQEYKAELRQSQSLLELKERLCMQAVAERNFLIKRAELIRCMEAELILYKTKFEECECKMLALKETIVKAEIMERKLMESQHKLKTVESQLQESELQNENLIGKIEQLDNDLKDRNHYIECLSKRLQAENNCSRSSTMKVIKSNEVIHGKVQSIVQQISQDSSKVSTCRCNIENCHCAVVGKNLCVDSKASDLIECNEKMMKNEGYISNSSNESLSKDLITCSETDKLKKEISCDEIKLLRQQNEEFDKEIRRLKDQLSCVSQVLEDIEKERISNCELESEMSDLKIRHSRELEQVNSNFRASICQKMSEIQEMEEKCAAQMCANCRLEKELLESNEKLCKMEKYCDLYEKLSESYESLDTCHKERLKEFECLRDDCHKLNEECLELSKNNELLRAEMSRLKTLNEMEIAEKNSSKDQRNLIRKSVMEIKRFHDEKAFMIKSYEKKIRCLEAENESLKCFRDKYLYENEKKQISLSCDDILLMKLSSFGIDSLDYDELCELHDRVQCAMLKVSKKDSHIDIKVNYSKMIEELCQKYNITSSKELILDSLPVRDNREIKICSNVTYQDNRRVKKRTDCKKRSKSTEMAKKSVR